jgi:hypothetical protein
MLIFYFVAFVQAMYDYEAQDGDEVSFRDGDIIGTPSPYPNYN